MNGWKRVACWVMYKEVSEWDKGQRIILFLNRANYEMAKVGMECLFVAFIDMEKKQNLNGKELLEVMQGYGVLTNLVDVIERIYDGSKIKFIMRSTMAGTSKSDSGV